MIIATDFDGTLCEHKFPVIGQPIAGVLEKLIEYKKNGDKIILWTCREGHYLRQAIAWCKDRGLEFDAVNENVTEEKNKDYGIRKIFANIYLDDRNITIEEFIK